MALESAPFDVPLTGGLSEKADPRVLPPGSYAALENLVPNKAGALTKRYGFATVSDADSSGPIESPCDLLTHQDRPVTVSNPTGETPQVYQHDGTLWRTRGQVEFGRVTLRQEVSRPSGSIFFERLHRLATTPVASVVGLWVEAETVLDSPATDPNAKIYYRVLDAVTGVESVPRTIVFSSNNNPFASCAFGTNRVLFAQATSTTYVVRSLDVTTGVASTIATITPTGTEPGAIDLCVYDASNIFLAFRDGTALRCEIRNATTGALQSAATIALSDIDLIAVTADLTSAPKRLWVFADANPNLNGFGLTSSSPTNLVASTGIVVLDTGGHLRLAPEAIPDVPGLGPCCLLVASNQLASSKAFLLDATFAPSAVETLPRSLAATKPVTFDGRLWMAFVVHAGVSVTAAGNADIGTTCLVSIAVAEEVILVRLCAVLGRLRSTYDLVNETNVGQLALAGQTFEVPARTFLGVGRNLRFGLDWSRVSVNPFGAGTHQSAPCVSAQAFSGGHTAWLDGERVVELGYVQDPQITLITQVAGTGAVAIGTYEFFACYEWTDAQGNLHRSTPSNPFRVSVVGANSTLTVNVTTTWLTALLGATRRPILIHIFRTLAGPGPDIFRLTNAVTAVRNNGAVATVSFATGQNDATVTALGLGFLYTGAERPALTPPAPNAFLTHKRRGWIGAADERGAVYPSKPINGPGLAPEFSDEFAILLPQAVGPVTALAPLDDAVVAFTETQVFVIAGEGRAANGQGGDFSVVQIPSEHGCINAASVASTDAGVFFQSARGICLVGRDQAVSYAGAAVETLVGQSFSAIRSVVVDQRRRRVIWLCRSSFSATFFHAFAVLDLDTGVWSQWTVGANVTGQALSLGQHWVSTTNAQFGRESGFRDFGAYVTSVIETPWLRVGALVGHQRTRRWALAAEVPDPCVLNLDIYVDLDPNNSAQNFAIDLGPTTRVVGLPHARLNEQIAPQKHSTIKLRFSDTEHPDDLGVSLGRGLDYGAIHLDVAGKRGLARAAAGNRS